MATIQRGSFSVNLGIVTLTGELSDQDRQAAWELYTELSTRVALTGKQGDAECSSFEGEVLAESLSSVYSFFQEARRIMRAFPVGKLGVIVQDHLGVIINNVMADVLRPFLERWQADYRYWWECRSNSKLTPFERQQEYPKLKEFCAEWSDLRKVMRKLQETLVDTYKLVRVRP
jgi:hypothetical protein